MALEPGMYLNLSPEEYFGDFALSCSGIKDLLRSPSLYWTNSAMNPNRDRDKVNSAAMKDGSMFGTLLLEPNEFFNRYVVIPGQAFNDKKLVCSRKKYEEMLGAVEVICALPDSGKYFDKKYGYPEVTLVWDDPRGVRCRCRVDFFCWEWNVDYKTVDKIDDEFIHRTFRNNKYHIQDRFYIEGRKMVRQQIRQGTAKIGPGFSDAFIAQFMQSEDDQFIFIFQERRPPYCAVPIIMENDGSWDAAERDIDRAIKRWQQNVVQHGFEEKWPSSGSKLRSFSLFYGFKED